MQSPFCSHETHVPAEKTNDRRRGPECVRGVEGTESKEGVWKSLFNLWYPEAQVIQTLTLVIYTCEHGEILVAF